MSVFKRICYPETEAKENHTKSGNRAYPAQKLILAELRSCYLLTIYRLVDQASWVPCPGFFCHIQLCLGWMLEKEAQTSSLKSVLVGSFLRPNEIFLSFLETASYNSINLGSQVLDYVVLEFFQTSFLRSPSI